jgi:hypothetical protein
MINRISQHNPYICVLANYLLYRIDFCELLESDIIHLLKKHNL